jgi:hypothetical protein
MGTLCEHSLQVTPGLEGVPGEFTYVRHLWQLEEFPCYFVSFVRLRRGFTY